MTATRLGAAELRAVVLGYRDALEAHKAGINKLNVYPVPDGDTGTNMALTLASVVDALEGADDMDATCAAIARGSLMGARGNSGVILSQILRGVTQRCREEKEVGPDDLAEALHQASQAAYGAVMKPVEGTILTVAKEAAEAARETAGGGKSLVDVVDAARKAAGEALDRTPELLPVLAEAGVVDAGGLGYVLFFDALLHVVAGRPLPEPEPVEEGVGVDPATAPSGGDGGGGDLRYEVMYFLEAPDEEVPSFKEAWAEIGDSIVVVGGDGTWNCHIHTDDVGAAIEAALDHGRPRQIRVTDLRDQVEEEQWVREGAGRSPDDEDEGDEDADANRVSTAVVAVASGEGLHRILRSLGVQGIVAGGQSMNPSTAQLLEAVEAAPSDAVVVLPNNKNIVPVAREVDSLTAKSVKVVPTSSVPEGLAALLEYHAGAALERTAEAMAEAAGRVVSGQVTRAVRDSSSAKGPISEGDWLGLSTEGIETIAGTVSEAATGLLEALVTEDHEVVTVLEGEDATPEDTEKVKAWLEDHRPGVEVEVHQGGQPLYPYLLSIE